MIAGLSLPDIAGVAGGVGLLSAGLWALARARPGRFEPDPTEPDLDESGHGHNLSHAEPMLVPLPGMPALTRPTALVLGLALAGAGYHLVAWSLPPTWLALRVPIDRWHVVIVAAVVAVGGSIAVDLLARRADDADGA